jgi:hypothetical protein
MAKNPSPILPSIKKTILSTNIDITKYLIHQNIPKTKCNQKLKKQQFSPPLAAPSPSNKSPSHNSKKVNF